MGHYDDQYDALEREQRMRVEVQRNAALDAIKAAHKATLQIPLSRPVSLALTKLEEARHWLGEL